MRSCTGRRADRINTATLALAQSREHDWLEASLPEYSDADALARDGERLPQDIGTRPFVADPVAGARLLAIALRRARASATYRYRLKPGAAMEWLAIAPSDWLTVSDPEHGFADHQVMVTRTGVNEDWSVTLDLVEQPDGVYADTLVLPPLKPRAITFPTIQTVPAVTSLLAVYTYDIARDGTVVWHIDVIWDYAPYQTRIRVTDGNEVLVTEASISGTAQRFTVDTPGTYNVSAYHVTLDGFSSPSAETTVTFSWSDVPMPAPVIISSEQYGTQLQLVAMPVVNRDVTGIEVRYTREEIDGVSDLAAIDEAGWLTAARADVALVAPINSDQPIVGNVLIPSTGRYRMFCRLFNRVGNYSPITEIGYKVFVIPAVETLTPQQWPLPISGGRRAHRKAGHGPTMTSRRRSSGPTSSRCPRPTARTTKRKRLTWVPHRMSRLTARP